MLLKKKVKENSNKNLNKINFPWIIKFLQASKWNFPGKSVSWFINYFLIYLLLLLFEILNLATDMFLFEHCGTAA